MTVDGQHRRAAVLVGNGLSIAFNSALNLASITQEMISRMESASDDGSKVVRAMKEIARRALSEGDVTDQDFEKLVGAFDSQSLTLHELSKLAELVESEDKELHKSIQDVATFSQKIRDVGISYVLEVIMERSRGDWILHEEMHRLIGSLIDEFGGVIHIGNLNYDTLLLSALKAMEAPICDLGNGFAQFRIQVKDEKDPEKDGVVYLVTKLRETANFPSGDRYRVRLLHLHGSLTYWHSTERELHFKAPVDLLRKHEMWAGLREAETKWRPSVVLASQRDKAYHVERYPFKLAYEEFERGLKASDHWLVIGYSFRDSCVNDILRNEFIRRKDKPLVLVSTYGPSPTDVEVERAFGWGAEDEDSSRWLTINRDGARGLEQTSDWATFTYYAPLV